MCALDVFGVDIIDAGDGAPLIVDVNAFPASGARPAPRRPWQRWHSSAPPGHRPPGHRRLTVPVP
ncbi:hypothetical protein AB0F64_04040 [Streptomyces sp. NPDC026294]|uniref:hypothetical protein n=1 Tax=Streptomyces sp. NPDC026294 TaxID=3155362 RepID=UPI0033D9F131